ncbi:MAG TPA: radical SAM protein [Candidatus Dojkabacteria bacterium]|nr:radical SAM protein [Candidatus Dojkabacteria bacterium]HQF36791.1 radical SAM protein [Candidatus Dojkabacteria bacterium]
MKVTLIYPDFEYRKSINGFYVEHGGWYHEGIAQLGAVAEEEKVDLDLIHLTGPIGKEEFIEDLKKRNPDVVGFSALRTGNLLFTKDAVQWAKEALPKAIIILGGYLPTLEPEKSIAIENVDAIFLGEGEISFAYFLRKVKEGKSFKDTPSTWVKDGDQIVKNKMAPVIENLDDLPLPKFDLFDFEKLIVAPLGIGLALVTRGCPYNCTYCWNNRARKLYPNQNKYVRFRSPRNAVDYLKKLLEHYPKLRKIRFEDDIWPVYKEWGEELKELYLKEIGLPFDCNYRANLFTEQLAKLLKEMGCEYVYFGVESGNEHIRNNVLKRMMSEEDIIKAFDLAKKYKLKTCAYNIMGSPYENMRTALDTIKLNAKINPDVMFFPIYYPYGGSDLHQMSIDAGFYDPNKPLDPLVNVVMPDFSRNQILFAFSYAKLFVRLYQLSSKFPGFLGKLGEKVLDRIWLCKILPHFVLYKLMSIYRLFINASKRFIRKRLTPLYFVLKKSKILEKLGNM